MTIWKLLGIAGLAGVAATGVVVARDERRRRAATPDDVRARLHERLDLAGPPDPPVATHAAGRHRSRSRWRRAPRPVPPGRSEDRDAGTGADRTR